MDVEVLLVVILEAPHEDFLLADLAAQVARQGDAVIERVALGGEHHYRGFRVARPELLGTGLTGDAVAEDDVLTGQFCNLNE